MFEYLNGRKTYLFTLAAALWKGLHDLHGLPAWVTEEWYGVVLAALLGAAGMALRAGVQKSSPTPTATSVLGPAGPEPVVEPRRNA